MPDFKVMVEFDGESIPLSKCDWLWYDPNDHVIGVTVAAGIPDEDAAYAQFEAIKKDRDLQLSWGFYMDLIDHRKFGELAAPCLTGRCDHPSLETMGIHVCRLCGRLGKKEFQTVVDKDGKTLLRCVGRTACRKREIRRYSWRPAR